MPIGVTHVMTPIAVTRSLPLVTNMAVVGQSTKHVAHILTNSSLDKVTDSNFVVLFLDILNCVF